MQNQDNIFSRIKLDGAGQPNPSGALYVNGELIIFHPDRLEDILDVEDVEQVLEDSFRRLAQIHTAYNDDGLRTEIVQLSLALSWHLGRINFLVTLARYTQG